MGLDQEKRCHRYYRVLSRASWSSRELSGVLLGLLVEAFVPQGDPCERLPNLSEVAQDPTTVWKMTTIANGYGSGDRVVEVSSKTAVWYSTGLFAVPLRWVLVRDPKGEFKTQALLCTDLDADPQKILRWFVRRWQMEICRTHYPHKPQGVHLHAA